MPTIQSSQLKLNEVVPRDSTPDNTLVIRSDSTGRLPLGIHTFQLVVVDDAGNRSQPAFAQVTVFDAEAPTALIAVPDQRIAFGQDFSIDGSPSFDVGGGTIVRWEWTLVPQQPP